MKKFFWLLSLSVLGMVPFALSALGVADYAVAPTPWPEHYGLHRAVVRVAADNGFVGVEIPWRLKKSPLSKAMYVVEAETGAEMKWFARRQVTRDSGFVSFKANKAGLYYVYYLPYKIDDTWAGFKGRYEAHNPSSLVRAKALLAPAEFLRIESRTELDSFYPMEVMPTDSEKTAFFSKNRSELLIFVENRKNQIRMKRELPYKWIQSGEVTELKDSAASNEWYPIQIGVVANRQPVQNLRLMPSDLVSESGNRIDAGQMVCINTNGVDPWGHDFIKRVDVPKGNIQPMWLGVDLNATPAGVYSGEVAVVSDNCEPRTVRVELTVTRDVLPNRGDNDLWRLTRLRWLNSRLGLNDNEMIAPYVPVTFSKAADASLSYQFSLLNRQVVLGKNGLPASVSVGGRELLTAPVTLGANIDSVPVSRLEVTHQTPYRVDWEWSGENDALRLSGKAYLEADGYMDFSLRVTAKEEAAAGAALSVPLKKSVAKYLLGVDAAGSGRFCPDSVKTGWLPNRDSFWAGDVDAGVYVEMQGASYTGPMLNLYHPEFSPCWHNKGAGSYGVSTQGDTRFLSVDSGDRRLKSGDSVTYDFAFIVTPMKQIDWNRHFNERYYHMTPPMELRLYGIDRNNYTGSVEADTLMASKAMPVDNDINRYGVNVVNIHQALPENCYINYPFVNPDRIKNFVTEAHAKQLKVKLYYTVRELSNSCYEIWALRSLGNECFLDGNGGGYIWLQEHLENDYSVAMYSHNGPVDCADAAITTSGISRWYNYYVEGLHWMIQEYGIDGIYIDDVTFDRAILKRIRRVMESVKPGCLLDLHSNTGFSKGPILQYMEFFPYVDRLWFGESFFYNRMSPEAILTECSGIPFGVGGEMLYRGGNPWRGLLYGMTNRLPWFTEGRACDPRPIWALWDEVGMKQGGRFHGFWETDAVTVSDPSVKASFYQSKDGKRLLIALASFAPAAKEVRVGVDWKRLKVDPSKAIIELPEVNRMQSYGKLDSNLSVRVEPIKGALIRIRVK